MLSAELRAHTTRSSGLISICSTRFKMKGQLDTETLRYLGPTYYENAMAARTAAIVC